MKEFPISLELSSSVFLAFWLSLIASGILANPIMKILIQLKSRQTISAFVPEHQAKQGTPTMGGLIIMAGVLVSWGFLAVTGKSALWEPILIFVLFGVIGFVDDFVIPKMMEGKRGLGWKQKIVMELLFAAVPVMIVEKSLSIPSLILGVFLILFFANAYNFADGLDALAGTVGLGLLVGLMGLIALVTPAPITDLVVCAGLAAAFLPFLYFNAPPAKVFMGDVGALPIGAVLGLVVWRQTLNAPNPLSMGFCLLLLSLVMCAELIPVPLQIASVKLRGKKIFLRTPIHHAFQSKGMPETRIVYRFALAQLILSALAIAVFLMTNYTVFADLGSDRVK